MNIPKPSPTQDDFHQNLNEMSEKFAKMQPELEVTLRDEDLDLEGFIVVWNTAISREGPLANCGKGGTRLRKGLSLDEIKMLAKKMAIKNAAAGLPLGGCKSGINADPKANNFERKYRRFVELCKPFTHENGGSFGGFGYDIGASPEHALWACETLRSNKCFTGKPLHLGGTDYDKEGIAGLGVAEAAVQLLKVYDENLEEARFSVHGAGAMGSAVIRYLSEKGPQLSSIGDPKFGGTWQFENAPSRELLFALANQDLLRSQKLLEIEARCVSKSPDAVLVSPCDILLPCAVHNVIHGENAKLLQCRYIVEGANNPCTPEAYRLIFERNIPQVPDFIANSGGVIAAFVEMTSTISDEENARTAGKVNEAKTKTQNTIRDNISRIVSTSKTFNTSLHDAGMHLALSAVFCRNNRLNT